MAYLTSHFFRSMVREVSAIPKESRIPEFLGNKSFSDSFKTNVRTKSPLGVEEVVKCFLSSTPLWVKIMFSIRERIASLGLKTADSEDLMQSEFKERSFQVNERFGLFKIYAVYPDEIIMGEDDSHLNFRLSWYVKRISDHESNIFCSTTVEINNSIGRVYFFLVKPFHKMVVKSFMKKIRLKLSA